MFKLIHESGFAGWVTVLLTIAGIAAVTTVGRRWARPGSIAAAWSVAILASGAAGFGLGQRQADAMLHPPRRPATSDGAPARPAIPLEDRMRLLSRANSEAAANYVLAGGGALIVSFLGGTLVLFRKREPGEGGTAPAPAAPRAA